jgi:hypothetical protein
MSGLELSNDVSIDSAVFRPARARQHHGSTNRRHSSPFLLLLLAFIACIPAHVGSVPCGSPGYAEFATDGSDLRSAVGCYFDSQLCRQSSLPPEAQGFSSANMLAFYGFNISHWCVGKVVTFDYVFSYLSRVSHDQNGCSVDKITIAVG